MEEKPKEVELRVENNKVKGKGMGGESAVQEFPEPICNEDMKEKPSVDAKRNSSIVPGAVKAKSSPVDPKFFKRSIVLTASDPVITRLRKEVSNMIHRMHNVDRVCKTILSKHLRSMKTEEREKELKKLLHSRIDPSKHYLSRHSLDVLSCGSEKEQEGSASTEEAAELDIMLENDRGISIVFSPTKQSFFNAIVGDQRTREGRLLERLRSKFEETNGRGKQSHDTMHTCLPCAINNFSSYLVQLVAARYHIENVQNDTDGSLFVLLRTMTRSMVFTKLYDVCISYNSQIISQKDELWRKKSAKLKLKTQGEMHIEKKFQILTSDPTKRPYANSIQCIEGLTNCKTPDHMTAVLLKSIKTIHNEAKIGTGASIGGMDDLLPILVYVLVQSNLQSIHRCLAFMQNFSANVNNGEASFYMCCLQAGVIWTLRTENDDDADEHEEERKVADLQETKMFTASEESIADEELQQWMIGVDMIEDSYDMLL